MRKNVVGREKKVERNEEEKEEDKKRKEKKKEKIKEKNKKRNEKEKEDIFFLFVDDDDDIDDDDATKDAARLSTSDARVEKQDRTAHDSFDSSEMNERAREKE